MDKSKLIDEIISLKKEKKALILAHLYQSDDIQMMADYTGDSLELSRIAKESDEQVIVFCGVRFMAETAKILAPEKKIVFPVLDAKCDMARMVDVNQVNALKNEYPGAAVVCYVNSTSEVKAVSDYCCTSANAVTLVENIEENEIIFVPDKNLGAYVARNVPEKTFHFVRGFCPVHHALSIRDVESMREKYPGIRILAHPECKMEVLDAVDFVGSTSKILAEARNSSDQKLIIATEEGTLYRLKKESPQKEFILLTDELVCRDMKKIGLNHLRDALKNLEPLIEVDEETSQKARLALERMLQYS